jgi:hypothetical protein
MFTEWLPRAVNGMLCFQKSYGLAVATAAVSTPARHQADVEALTHDLPQHFRRVIVSDQIDGKRHVVQERSLEWMLWLRLISRIAFIINPCGLYQASGLVGFHIQSCRVCESAWFGGLDIERGKFAARSLDREVALDRLI